MGGYQENTVNKNKVVMQICVAASSNDKRLSHPSLSSTEGNSLTNRDFPYKYKCTL